MNKKELAHIDLQNDRIWSSFNVLSYRTGLSISEPKLYLHSCINEDVLLGYSLILN